MLRSLFTGVTGLKAHQVRLDVISNNIANVNTTAFKGSRVRFDDVLSQTIEIATAPESGRGGQNPKQIGLGVLGTTISRDMTQGAIEITNKTTDLAIQGGGFFVLRDGENIGEYFTRDGSFAVDRDGSLVEASNGFRAQGWNSYLDSKTNSMVINSSNPVENVVLNMSQQMAPIATSTVEMGGNLDVRMSTAIDPIRVSWQKNGTSREIEMRFKHVSPSLNLYLWEVYDPSQIDATTGDYTKLTTDMNGMEMSGILEVDDNGKVVANYLNTADDNAADPAADFLDVSELPDSGDLWALNYLTRTFNGYDFFTLDSNGDGDSIQFEEDSRLTSQSSSTNAIDPTVNDVTITVPNAPLSSTPLAGGTYPNGFTQDAVYQTGTSAAGNANLPGDGLGAPVQYVESVTNEVVSKISSDRTQLQLAHSNIIDSARANPAADGRMSSANGTDSDSLRLFIDGNEYTRIDNADAFTSGNTEFKLDPDNGVITLGSSLANGINAIVTYDYEMRPTNTRSIPSTNTMTLEFGARGLGGGNRTTWTGTTTSTTDLSAFYVSGSGTLTLVDTSRSVSESFTEVANSVLDANLGANQFKIDPTTGQLVMGTFSNGDAVELADTVSGSYQTFRSWGEEQTSTVVVGTTVDNAEIAFAALPDSGGQNPPYISGSVGTIQLANVSAGGAVETFVEVAWGQSLSARQFSVNPQTGDLSFGTFFSGEAVDEANDTFANVDHDFDFFEKRIGVTDGAGPNGAGNVRGGNDLWRVMEIPNGGGETGNLNLWLQGDGFTAGVPNRPSDTSLNYLPDISSIYPARRAELNYNSDDRVNIIIPNGLTKNPNVNPLVDKTVETFSFTPNTSQITGNNGNNNQADSGDASVVSFNSPEDYLYSTAVEAYDSVGRPWNVPLKFERLDTHRWIMYAIDPTDADQQRVAFQRIIAFNADGTYDSSSTIPYEAPTADGTTNNGFQGIYFDPQQSDGAPLPPEGADLVMITPNFTNLFQTARGNDAVVTSQNGAPPGRLESYSFNDEGFLVGLFDNGKSLNLGRIALQGFVNPAGLVAVGQNMFKDTVNAGKYGSPQRPGFDGVGTIVPGALEMSNVDLSVEFVDMIITQRGFQAQSRTITTADQVLQELLSLKR